MSRIPSPAATRNLWRILVVGMGGLHSAVAILKQSMNADGINYLEIGAAYWRGDWEMALNGVWSPLYGLIASGFLALVSPETAWVFSTVQVVNFLVFLASLVCFEFFWREARRSYKSRLRSQEGVSIPLGLWWSLGYALFLWSSLNLTQIWSVTPDMLVSAIVYLAAGFLLRTVRHGGRGSSIGLGLALGFGYLAKAPMFLLSLACFVLAALAMGDARVAVRRLGPGVLAFLFLAGPFVAALSVKEGHPTFSEVTRFTYLKHVNRIPYPQWRGDAARGLGEPLHPPVLLHASPDLFHYPGPVRGSYPPSHDPNFFTKGLRPRVDLGEQLNELAFNLAFYFKLFFWTQGLFMGAAFVALLAALGSFHRSGPDRGRSEPTEGGATPKSSGIGSGWGRAGPRGEWYLTAWALACFAMYSLVFVTERYLGPFVVLFWAGFLSYWLLESSPVAERLSRAAGALMVLALLANVAALNLEGFAGVAGLKPPVEAASRGRFSDGPSTSPPRVAEALRAAGVEKGTDVGLIGYGFTAHWAYLAGVRIVAEMVPEEAPAFWGANDETRSAVLEAFRASGAAYVVAEVVPARLPEAGTWRPLPGTGYWLLDLAVGCRGAGG